MAKGKKSVFFCQNCGYESPKWHGLGAHGGDQGADAAAAQIEALGALFAAASDHDAGEDDETEIKDDNNGDTDLCACHKNSPSDGTGRPLHTRSRPPERDRTKTAGGSGAAVRNIITQRKGE